MASRRGVRPDGVAATSSDKCGRRAVAAVFRPMGIPALPPRNVRQSQTASARGCVFFVYSALDSACSSFGLVARLRRLVRLPVRTRAWG